MPTVCCVYSIWSTVRVQNELGNVAGEATLSILNTAKQLGGRSSARTPLGELTALP